MYEVRLRCYLNQVRWTCSFFVAPAAIFAHLLPLYLPWMIFLIVLQNKYKTNTKYKYTNINTRQADVIVFLYLSLLWHCLFLLFMIVRESLLDTQFLPMPSMCALSVFCPFTVLVFLSLTLHSSNRSINQINKRHKLTLQKLLHAIVVRNSKETQSQIRAQMF